MIHHKIVSKLIGARTNMDFTLLFLRKEGRVLLGRRFSNFFFLLSILFLTFLAIGIANGSLDYLEKKMDDPFIKWIPVNIPMGKSDSVSEYMRILKEDTSARDTIEYVHFAAFKYLYLNFWDQSESKIIVSIKGRTIEANDELLTEIFAKQGNRVFGDKFTSNNQLGLIVTTKLLKKLGYDAKAKVLFLKHSFSDPLHAGEYVSVPIPIIGVVNNLPGVTDFFCTPVFYYHRFQSQQWKNPFSPELTKGIELITYSKKDQLRLEDALNEFFKYHTSYSSYDPHVWPDNISVSYQTAYRVTIGLLPDESLKVRNDIYEAIIKDKNVNKIQFLRFYDFYTQISSDNTALSSYDWMTIKLDNLGNLSKLESYLLSKFDLPVDMAQRETRENYFFVTNLTNIIALSLIVFSILSICLFISSLLQNHLERMKMNIGTFKAFGLGNKSLDRIYFSIIYLFVITAMIIAIVLSWIVGQLNGIKGLFILAGHPVEQGEKYFTLVRPWTDWSYVGWSAFSIVMILFTSFLALKYITGKIFKKTPGDLIYDRNE